MAVCFYLVLLLARVEHQHLASRRLCGYYRRVLGEKPVTSRYLRYYHSSRQSLILIPILILIFQTAHRVLHLSHLWHVPSPVDLSLVVDLHLHLDLAGHRAELALVLVVVGVSARQLGDNSVLTFLIFGSSQYFCPNYSNIFKFSSHLHIGQK